MSSLESINPIPVILAVGRGDIETLISLYLVNKTYQKALDDAVTLKLLSRHTPARCFEDFVSEVDTTTLTKRSKNLVRAGQLLAIACLAGNSAVISECVLEGALLTDYDVNLAARSGNKIVVDMLHELTGKRHQNEILAGYARGGHWELFNGILSVRYPGTSIPWRDVFKSKRFDVINRCLMLMSDGFGHILREACIVVDDVGLLELIIKHSVFRNKPITKSDLNSALGTTINFSKNEKNRLAIVKFLLSHGADACDAFEMSCHRGRTEIIEYFLGLGHKCKIDDFWLTPQLLDLVISSGDIDLDDDKAKISIKAAELGNLPVVISMLEKGTDNHREIFLKATINNSVNVVEHLCDHHSEAIDTELLENGLRRSLDHNGLCETFYFLVPRVPEDFVKPMLNKNMVLCAEDDCFTLVREYLRLGADNYQEALDAAVRNGGHTAAKILKRYINK